MLRLKFVGTSVLLSMCIVALPHAPAAQQEQSTPEEVIAKVKEAAEYLHEAGQGGLQGFQSKDSEYVWKDTYVVVNDCDQKTLAAYPIRPELAGSPFADAPSFGGMTGEQVGTMLCQAGQQPQGGWVEYLFPKPGEKEPSRKLSYARAVEGTPYVAIGGIYGEDAKVEDLEVLVGQ
jgi:signal transduction histidine kinase